MKNKYYFKKDYKKEYLRGRTIKYVSNMINISREYLTNILNGKIYCSKIVATKIVTEEKIEYYFTEGE